MLWLPRAEASHSSSSATSASPSKHGYLVQLCRHCTFDTCRNIGKPELEPLLVVLTCGGSGAVLWLEEWPSNRFPCRCKLYYKEARSRPTVREASHVHYSSRQRIKLMPFPDSQPLSAIEAVPQTPQVLLHSPSSSSPESYSSSTENTLPPYEASELQAVHGEVNTPLNEQQAGLEFDHGVKQYNDGSLVEAQQTPPKNIQRSHGLRRFLKKRVLIPGFIVLFVLVLCITLVMCYVTGAFGG